MLRLNLSFVLFQGYESLHCFYLEYKTNIFDYTYKIKHDMSISFIQFLFISLNRSARCETRSSTKEHNPICMSFLKPDYGAKNEEDES